MVFRILNFTLAGLNKGDSMKTWSTEILQLHKKHHGIFSLRKTHVRKSNVRFVGEAFHAKSDGLKILIFDFLHFWPFILPIKKLFLVNFEIFSITGLKDIQFRFFANFFKNGQNSFFFFFFFYLFICFFCWNICLLFRKKLF